MITAEVFRWLIRSRLDEAVELGAKFLEEWGVKLTPRPAGTKVASAQLQCA